MKDFSYQIGTKIELEGSRIMLTHEGWLAQDKFLFWWSNTPVTDLNGVSGRLVFPHRLEGMHWLKTGRLLKAVSVTY